MKKLFNNSAAYAAVRQTDVYHTTTEPLQESLSPTQAVFHKYLKGQFNDKPKWVFTTMICGLCAITIGSIILAVNPYEIVFRQKVTFYPDSEEFVMWEKPEVELYLKVYLFNVTNSEEFMSGKENKLRFQQTGPYVYRELMHHSNATFNENGTITSIPVHPLVYMPHMTNGSQDDYLIMPNIALLSFAQVMRDASIFTRLGVNMLIKNTKTQPLVRMTAKEFMFSYKSTLLTIGNSFLPNWIHFDKLGLIDRMYNFDGDSSTTFSGQKDIRRSGLIDNYRGTPYLPHWPSPPCNNVSYASDGTKFPSRITKDQELLFFRRSLCRSMPLVRVGEEVVSGMHAYRYNFKKNALDNGEVDPKNKCFCKNKCFPRGIFDVQDCYYGFPIALSYPHFMDADPKVLDSVEGLKPDHDLHHTYFVINEESGLPLNVSVKMQINMVFDDLSKISNVPRFSHRILPMLWMDITMKELPPSMARKFYLYLTVGPIAQALSTYLLLTCGVAFILLSLASALLIPRMRLVSSNRGDNQESVERKPEPPIGKKRVPTIPMQNNNREMDMYYCSLLAVPPEES
ncbi:unnamed protein product [Nezara viridula]|uniref:Scavenger receptor class B member 1 n=1 Tax=Nezara viridula TaxID=85310 RepID=A0A9P0HJZ9_NEZVI|nr:unnamed protein product [Nezara viridula]